MKQIMTVCNVILFCLLLATFVVIGVLTPKDMTAAEEENRELAAMPALTRETVFSGSFSQDFENYLADNVGYRSFFMDAATRIESLKGIKTKSGRIVTTTKDLGTGAQGDNYLLVLPDRVMEVYKQDDAARNAYINALNLYAETLPTHTRIFSMLIPTQIEFHQGKTTSDSEKKTIDYIYENMNNRIISVPVYDVLKSHKDEYIYFRTDHHWTQLGAFYGYTAFAETAFSQTPQLSEYKKNHRDGFLGYLYNQAKDPSLEKHADTIEWYEKGENLTFTAKAMTNGELVTYSSRLFAIPQPQEAPKYGIFMGGDHQFAEIQTQNKNGKTLLVMKDSYANTLLPFLTEQYETLLVIDPRNFYSTVTALSEEYKIDDVLFVNYVFTTTFSDFVGKMVAVR